jgi:hypothetical protein
MLRFAAVVNAAGELDDEIAQQLRQAADALEAAR